MKQAGSDTRIIRDADGRIWGIFLAGNGCSEHEHGIAPILSFLNIDAEGRMLLGRSMTAGARLSEAFGQVTRTYHLEGGRPLKQTDRVAYLAMRQDCLMERSTRCMGLERYRLDTDITAAWSEREFKLAGWTSGGQEALRLLADAVATSDLAVWVGNTPDNVGNPFSHSGIVMAIASRMPDEAIAALDDSDEEALRLADAAEKTGIRRKIEERAGGLQSWPGGPAYHALAPKWVMRSVHRDGVQVRLETIHPVAFFLNPARQGAFNHGWFTVEELEQWLEGRGPVIKKEAKSCRQ